MGLCRTNTSMVLRYYFALFILFSCLTAQAKSPLEQANDLYKTKQFNKSLAILSKHYKIKKITSDTPPEVYELVGKVFVQKRNFKMAIRFFRAAIASRYANKDKKAMQTYFKQGNADGLDELPEDLYKYYFLILGTSIYYADYLIENGQKPDNNLNQYVEVFGSILTEADYKTDQVEKLVKLYEGKIREIERSEFKSNWFMSAGYISWQDKVTFVDVDGSEYDLIAPAEGIGLGVGWQKHNFYWGYKFELRYSSLSANAGFNDSDVSYFQESVPVTFFGLEGGIFTLPFTGDVGIGLSVPVFFKSGQYEAPSGTEIKDASKISTGLILEGIWYTGGWSLTSQVGKIIGLTSAYWGVHLSYHFN